jgi:ubiquitin-activating enzyme E1 C
LCTIAHTPRLAEHCIEYARILLWPKENPFGDDVQLDGDDPHHIAWIYERARERAAQFGISGVTFRLTQGVVKHIIPAVASTNAVIAAALATEVFKVATSCAQTLNNYMVFNDTDGIYTYSYEAEKNPGCLGCSRVPQAFEVKSDETLAAISERLVEKHQMKQPGLRVIINGVPKTLYMSNIPSIETQTRPNLKKTVRGAVRVASRLLEIRTNQNYHHFFLNFSELGITSGAELIVVDATTPAPVVFNVKVD